MAQLGCQNEFAPDNLSLREWTALNNQMNVKWNENVHSSGLELIILLLSFSMKSVGDLEICGKSNKNYKYQQRKSSFGEFSARHFTSNMKRQQQS